MRTGFVFLGIYLLFSIWCVWEFYHCSGFLCGLVLYLPVFIPWLPILEALDVEPSVGHIIMIVFFVVNCFIVFWIGKVITKVVVRIKNRNKAI